MATEDKIAENMVVVSDKLVQYMDAAEKVINQYGGDAVNLGLNVLRIEAASNLFNGLLFGAFALLLAFYGYKAFNYGMRIASWEDQEDEKVQAELRERWRNNEESPRIIGGIILIGVGVLFAMLNIYKLFDIWNWVGIFWPEAYAVHKFLM